MSFVTDTFHTSWWRERPTTEEAAAVTAVHSGRSYWAAVCQGNSQSDWTLGDESCSPSSLAVCLASPADQHELVLSDAPIATANGTAGAVYRFFAPSE